MRCTRDIDVADLPETIRGFGEELRVVLPDGLFSRRCDSRAHNGGGVLPSKGLMPIWERVRNCMRVVRVSSPAAWERARESVLNGEELLLTPVPQTTESDPAE